MKPINYQLTNSMISNLIELETAKTKLELKRLDDSSKQKFEKDAYINNLFFFGNDIGISTTLSSIRKFADGKIDLSENDPKLILLRNFRNALDYIKANTNNNFLQFNTDLISHFNKLLIQNLQEDWEAKPRTSSEIKSEFDDLLIFSDNSVTPSMVGAELTNTYNWYLSNLSIHSLIRIGVVYFRLMRIAPFKNLNKFTNILLVQFLLNREGYSFASGVPILKLFSKYADDYKEIWDTAATSASGNITFWIERLIFDLKTETNELLAASQELNSKNEESSSKPFLNLNSRQVRAIKYLQTIPTLKREDYVKMFDISTMTAYRDLNNLLDKKILKTEGRGRATKYYLASR